MGCFGPKAAGDLGIPRIHERMANVLFGRIPELSLLHGRKAGGRSREEAPSSWDDTYTEWVATKRLLQGKEVA